MNPEHNHQAALIRWAALHTKKYPELKALYAVPNAAKRTARQGAWMKAEGLRAGVPDIVLPVPRGTYAGLFIEMKAGKNKPTPIQMEWHRVLREVGHRVEVCYSWLAAANVIEKYLNGVRW